MPILTTARFHTTVAALHQLPRDGLLEVAFVGRSNAGKSSAINVLCNRKRLAFSSRTPGRTQALNYFTVGPEDRPLAYLVDTPGYGYASAPLETKRTWDQLAGQYLQRRPQLAGVVLLADIRRGLTDLDRRLIGWVPPAARLAIVLTKSDKLGRQQVRQVMLEVERELAAVRPGADNVVRAFSALNRSGRDDLLGLVENWIEAGLPAGAPTVEDEKKPR
ncbi:MAG TPA: ribosome biogenesis GTP-binding protein YihA/YsxC [Burkholderiaceae bacterium]|nr:ribosome biogenesis GTP-binding protein YihA/YsxC [Burkholderiaceae bacterium]